MNANLDSVLLQESYEHSGVGWGGELEFPNTRSLCQHAHRIYNRYPARSISLVPRSILLSYLSSQRGREGIVLDPFMGSGTTAVEAQILGLSPAGVELDPFARLVANVRTTPLRSERRRETVRSHRAIVEKWEHTKSDQTLRPRLAGIEYWFAKKQFEDLLRLKTGIYRETEPGPVRDFLLIALADTIRPCSKAERQTLKPYISTKYRKTPSDVRETFEKSFAIHLHAIDEIEAICKTRRKKIAWLGADGSDFSAEKVGIAITSPPYINALDYVRCIKLESAWVGTGSDDVFQGVRKKQVGERTYDDGDVRPAVHGAVGEVARNIKGKDPRRGKVVESYFNDMYRNLECVHRALARGSQYHLIVGDSVVRGISIETHKIIARLAESVGFKWSGYYRYRIRDHRTSIPRKGQGGKIEFEHVVSLRKA